MTSAVKGGTCWYGYGNMRDRPLGTKRSYFANSIATTTSPTNSCKPNITPTINHSVLESGRVTGILCHLNDFIAGAILAVRIESAPSRLMVHHDTSIALRVPLLKKASGTVRDTLKKR